MAKKSQVSTSETTEKKRKEYKLDLFRQTLPALYRGNLDFYANCSEEERKEISPLILMRWVSLAENLQGYAPGLVNQFVNTGFWQLSKHPELQWKVLSTVASAMSSTTPRHKWMMPKKKKSNTPLMDGYLLQKYPMASDFELSIVKEKFEDEEQVKQMARDFGCTDAEIKDVVKEYRDHYGKKA